MLLYIILLCVCPHASTHLQLSLLDSGVNQLIRGTPYRRSHIYIYAILLYYTLYCYTTTTILLYAILLYPYRRSHICFIIHILLYAILLYYYVSSYHYIYVLIPLYVPSHYYMCPHTTICVLMLVHLQLSLLDSGVKELIGHPMPPEPGIERERDSLYDYTCFTGTNTQMLTPQGAACQERLPSIAPR